MTGQATALLRHLRWAVADAVEDGVNRARGRRPAQDLMPMLNGSLPESAASVARRYRAEHPHTPRAQRATRPAGRHLSRDDARSEH